jgi:predicted RNA-binding protein
MARMMTEVIKMKKKKSNYQKALERMERETNRAVAHVEALSELYTKTVKAQKKSQVLVK